MKSLLTSAAVLAIAATALMTPAISQTGGRTAKPESARLCIQEAACRIESS